MQHCNAISNRHRSYFFSIFPSLSIASTPYVALSLSFFAFEHTHIGEFPYVVQNELPMHRKCTLHTSTYRRRVQPPLERIPNQLWCVVVIDIRSICDRFRCFGWVFDLFVEVWSFLCAVVEYCRMRCFSKIVWLVMMMQLGRNSFWILLLSCMLIV